MAKRQLTDAEKAILGPEASALIGEDENVANPDGSYDQTGATEEQAPTDAPQATTEGSQDTTAAAPEETAAPAAEPTPEPTPEPVAPVVEETTQSAAPAVVSQSSAEEAAPVAVAEAPKPQFGAIGSRVMSILNDYAVKMAPRRPVTEAQIIEQQRLLFEAIQKTVNDSGDDFEPLLKAVLAFIEANKTGVFHETRVFRGMDNLPMATNDRTAFTRLINLFKLVANPQGRKLALKQVDLHASLQYGLSESGRNRLLSFFGN